MPKVSGLGQALYVGGRDISGDVGSINTIRCSRGVMDSTGIDKHAMERLLLLADGQMDFTAFLNVATDQAHDAFKGLPTADVQVLWFSSTNQGDVCAWMVAKQIDYAPSRNNDGSITIAISAQSNTDPVEFGRMLTAGKRTDSSATAAPSSIDTTDVTTAFGAIAVLQVFAFTGTSITIDIEDSANDSDFATVASMSFAAASAAQTVERIESPITGTIRRYIRAPSSGTFSNAIFSIGFERRTAAGI